MSIENQIFGTTSPIGKALALGNPMGVLINKWMAPKQPKLAPQMLGEMQDFKVKEGDARAIVFGIGRTIGGTLMYVSDPKRYMVKTYVGEAGGKGGGKKKKQYQDVEHISRSYAVGICEGEIGAVRRIWKNGKLAFDGRKGSEWGEKNNTAFLKDKEFYLGGYEQLPSPTLQTLLGTDIPAFRGTAYMVVSNEDLTNSNGAVPQYQFEVVRSEGQILTSRPYIVETVDTLSATPTSPSVLFADVVKDNSQADWIGVSVAADSLDLKPPSEAEILQTLDVSTEVTSLELSELDPIHLLDNLSVAMQLQSFELKEVINAGISPATLGVSVEAVSIILGD